MIKTPTRVFKFVKRGFPRTLFRAARRPRRLAGGTPDEGSPGPKQSTGLISGSPSCVSLRIIPERACSARSGEISRSAERDEGLRAPRPARPFEKGRRKLFSHFRRFPYSPVFFPAQSLKSHAIAIAPTELPAITEAINPKYARSILLARAK